MAEHNFIKEDKRWKCTVCGWTWTSKSKTICPEVTRYNWTERPENLKTIVELERLNLKPKEETIERGVIFSMKGGFYWLYSLEESEIDNPDLPPVYTWDNRGDLKTSGQLKNIGLEIGNALPKGTASIWDKKLEEIVWIPLYDPKDCLPKTENQNPIIKNWQTWEPDILITKTTLKERYLLSEGWVKKIGDPDKVTWNEYRRPVKLYSQRRIDTFFAENAEEYAAWLVKRNKYLEIFESNREKILEAGRISREKKLSEEKKLQKQMEFCFGCASGASTPQGFLCAIHPIVKTIPCPDWTSRMSN